MHKQEEIQIFDNPELKNHSKKTILNDSIKFYGSQKFTLANSFIEVNTLDKKLLTYKSYLNDLLQSTWLLEKTVLDLGSCNGFYSFSCLQKGVKSSLAIEQNDISRDLINSVIKDFDILNFNVENTLVKNLNDSADLVFAPNILPILSEKSNNFNSLEEYINKISKLTNSVLIIEWVDKNDSSLNLFYNSILETKDYGYNNFLNYMEKNFETVESLGELSSSRKLFIAYKSAEIKNEIIEKQSEKSLQEIFVELNEAECKYVILKNWEIITDFNDIFNDLTIDIFATLETKTKFESKLKNLNMENKDGYLSYKFHLGVIEGKPIDLFIRIFVNGENILPGDYLEQLYTNRVKNGAVYHLSENNQLDYLLFYYIYNLGAVNENNIHILKEFAFNSNIIIKDDDIYNISYLYTLFKNKEWKQENRNSNLALSSFKYIYPVSNVILSKKYLINSRDYIVRIYTIEENGKKFLIKQAKNEIIKKEFDLYNIFAPNSIKQKLEYIEENNYSLLKFQYDNKYEIIDDSNYYSELINKSSSQLDGSFLKNHLIYNNNKLTTVVLLGMHRSGTSVTMSILEKLGVHIGDDILGENDSNPLGHFEDIDFINLNDKILKAAGGDWDNPPTQEKILEVSELFEEEIKYLIKRKSLNVIWGWKDPRTCITLPLYLEYLENYKIIVVSRNTKDVANSLSRRNGFPLEFSLELIEKYQTHINTNLKNIDNNDILEINFEKLKEDKFLTVKSMDTFIGLNSNKKLIEDSLNIIVDIKPQSKNELITESIQKIGELIKEENYSEALGYIEIAIENISKNLIGSTNLMYIKALCEFKTGNINEAAESIINELILNPNNEYAAQLEDQITHELKKNNIDMSYQSFQSIEENYSLDLSIIIPAFNNVELTKACVDSVFLELSDRISFEIIVVDNGSDDGTPIFLDEYVRIYDNFKFIRNEANLGFAKANNQAIDLRKGKHVLLLNNDTIITKNSIESMYNKLEGDDKIGIVGACMLYPNTDIIQHLFVRIGTEDGKTLAPYHPFQFSKLEDFYVSQNNECSAVTGASMMIKSDLIRKIGVLDENYINGLEDIDYCLKAKSAGYKIIYSEESIIYHFESATLGRHDNDVINWERFNNRWLDRVNFDEKREDTVKNIIIIRENQERNKNEIKSNLKDSISENEKSNTKNNVDFSIIIPVKDNLEYTKNCIERIYQTSAFFSIEVIIIDNNSEQETKDYLSKISDLANVIINQENVSFSKANNQGADIAKGEYLIFLNNDTEVKENWLENIEKGFAEDKKIAIQGAKLLYPNNKIQHAGIVYGPLKEGLNHHYHIYLSADSNDEKVNKFREFQMITGALLSIRKDVFNKVDGFDENYYFGYEDLDLCLKVREIGYKVMYNPKVVATHFESITKKQEGIEKFERFIENPDSTDAINHNYFHSKWGEVIEVDAEKYYMQDQLYGLVNNKEKSKLFENEVRTLFELLMKIPDYKRNQIGSNVSSILFNLPNIDYINNKTLLFSIPLPKLIEANQIIEQSLNSIEKKDDKRKFKILMTMWRWKDTGGGTTFPNSIANKLSELGHEVYVFFAGGVHESVKQEYYLEESTENGIKLIGVYNRKHELLSASDPLNEIKDEYISEIYTKCLDDINPDIVHFHNFLGLSFEIAKITKENGYKTCFTPHNYHLIDPKLYLIEDNLEIWKSIDFFENSTLPSMFPKNNYQKRIDIARDLINKYIDITFAVSNRQREIFIEFGGNPNKISVINQIPSWLDAFMESKDIQRISQNKKNHKPLRVGYIGSLMSHKGVHNLIAATQKLNPEEIEVYIYGYGLANYVEMLENIESDINVVFKGEYESYNLLEIETELDLVVLPSIWEDCAPLTIAECLAMRLPVIAPSHGGFTDFIQDGFNGRIYNDLIELHEILYNYSKKPNEIDEMRVNCNLNYGFKDYLEHIINIYEMSIDNVEITPNNILKLFLDEHPSSTKFIGENNSENTESSSIENKAQKKEENKKNKESTAMNRLSFDQDKEGGYYNKKASGNMPIPLPTPFKLNLGCGRDIKAGFINIDLFSEDPSVVKMDIRELEIEDNSVDLIYANDILEHFSHRETNSLLKEWARVLKPNAELIIRCPNLRLQIEAYVRGDWDADVASFMIFGGQSNPGDYHCIGFDEKSIRKHLKEANLEILDYQEDDFPQDKGFINLNMTVRAKKIQINQKNDQSSNKLIHHKTQLRKVVRKINAKPQLNIVWEGAQFQYHSLALINREICTNIIESGQAELTIVPYGDDKFKPGGNTKYEQLASYDIRHKKDVSEEVLSLPYVWIRHQWPPDKNPPKGAKWIIMQPWEYSKLPIEFMEFFNDAEEIWTPSNFSRKAFIDSGIEYNKVQVIPNGINPDLFKPYGDKYELTTTKKLKLLFVGGTIARKGIDLLLKAYVQAFKNNDDVCLVIKDMGGDSFYKGQSSQSMINQIQEIDNSPEIEYIDNELSEDEIASLYRACNVFISTYRGEGFSLPTLEAMACGLPVIVTDGGATDDFVDNNYSWKIKSKQVKLNDISEDIKFVGEAHWLEPDIDETINTLKNVLNNPAQLFPMGLQASYIARTRWNWRNSTIRMMTRLDIINDTEMAAATEQALPPFSDDYTELGKAETLLSKGEYNSAKEIYNSLILNNSLLDDLKSYIINAIAFIEIELENYENAAEIIKENISDNNPDSKYILAKAFLFSGNGSEALEELNTLLQEWNELKYQSKFALSLDHLLCMTGDILLSFNDLEGAEQIFSSASQVNPKSSEAVFGNGMICKLKGENAKAKELFEATIELDPFNENARLELEELSFAIN